MESTTHQTLLPHIDPDGSLAFYRDTLGFRATGGGAGGDAIEQF